MSKTIVILAATLLLSTSGWPLPSSVSGSRIGPALQCREQPPDSAATTEGPRSQSAVLPQGTRAFVSLDRRWILARRFEENTARPLSTHLAVSANRFYGVEQYEISKLQCALDGADAGATLGLLVGALGMTAGLWDERAAGYIAGAAAALGAFRGMAMADEPGFRVRLRWQENDRGPRTR